MKPAVLYLVNVGRLLKLEEKHVSVQGAPGFVRKMLHRYRKVLVFPIFPAMLLYK